MGMYTELILGCKLKSETPSEVIDAIKWLTGDKEYQANNTSPIIAQGDNRINWMFNSGGSYYFGAHSGIRNFDYDDIGDQWQLTARFNIKNYSNEIQTFLDWLKPYIEQGSGNRDMYAIVTYEESEPELFFLDKKAV